MRTATDTNTGLGIDPTAFAAASADASAQIVTRCDLYYGGVIIEAGLRVAAATVSLDRRAAHFARMSGLVVDAAATDLPTRAGGRLAPGWEVKLWAGLLLPGNLLMVPNPATVTASTPDVAAVVPLGVFALNDATVDAYGVVTLDAWDRSMLMAADLLTATLAWPGPFLTLEAAVEDLVRRTFPAVVVSFNGATHTCPTMTFERDADPWRIIVDAATSAGCFARFNGDGWFTWSPEPDLSTAQPVATFGDGTGLVDLSVTVPGDIVNSWTVIGANPATNVEIVSTVYDDNPTSATRWGGPMGRRPKASVRMEAVDTVDKATAAAIAMRSAELGFSTTIDAEVVPHYLVEPPDAVKFVRPAAGVDGVALIEQQTLTLEPGSMRLTARSRQVTL